MLVVYLVSCIGLYSKDCFSVVSGGLEVAEAVTSQRFDYIFFTGGGSIGKKVMAKAAENLTPITLELGGKRCVHPHTRYISSKNPIYTISTAFKTLSW